VGTLVVAHGGGPDWNAQVVRVAEMVETGAPVEVSFLMGPGAGERPFQVAAARLVEAGAQRIVVVPLLVSSHSGHFEQVRYLVGETDSLSAEMRRHLAMGGIERPEGAVPLLLAGGMDDAPEIARALSDRALALAAAPAEQALFVVGHGPNSAERWAAWMRNMRVLADSVRAWSGFRDVKVGLVRDDAPEAVREEAVRQVRDVIVLQYGLTGRPVVVVPLLVAQGRITAEKLPADLAGLPIVYSGEALLAHPQVARWIESRVRETVLALGR
jgi:sirohydrochlorin ferrochelatase